MWMPHLVFCVLLALINSPACSAGDEDNDSAFSDMMVDEVINQLTNEINNQNQGQLSLPELNGKVKKKIAFVTLSASFLGQGGWLNNLTTVERSASSKMTSTDSTVGLELNIGIKDLNFGFQRFAINVIGMKLHGKLNAAIKKNSVRVALTITTNDDDTCHTDINKMEVTELEGINLKISGHNKVADWIYNEITNFVVNDFKKTIKNVVSKALRKALTKVLAEHEICDVLMI